MMTTICVASVVTSVYSLSISSPIKLSLLLCMTSLLLLVTTFLGLHSSFMSSILILIFLGGIMMMFMIISSICPNLSREVSSKYLWSMTVTILVLLAPFKISEISFPSSNLKAVMESSSNMLVLSLIIFFYFISFLKMMIDSSSPIHLIG